MLAVGAERAIKRGFDNMVTFEQGNAEEFAFPDRSFDCVTIAFGIRNVPRIERALAEAFRVLKIGGRFLCLEFSSVDVPGIDALYELYSFNVIPAIGRAVTGDREAYQYLVESIRKFPKPKAFAGMIERARAFADRGVVADSWKLDDRRTWCALHSGSWSRVIHPARFSHSPFHRLARAGFVFAREGVFALVDTRPLPLLGQDRDRARPPDRAAHRQRRHRAGLPPRLTRLGPTYVKLGQFMATRPDVVGAEIARDLESLQDKMAPFPQAQAEAASRRRFRQAAGRCLRELRPGGRRRLDRASA